MKPFKVHYKLSEVLKGEHFIQRGLVLYRKTEDGYKVVDTAFGEDPNLEIEQDEIVEIVNPHEWYYTTEEN